MPREEHQEERGDRTVVNLDPSIRLLGGFSQVPNAVLRHPSLSLGAKVVYGVLLSYSWQRDFCRPAQISIGRDCGISVRQVQRYLGELRQHGAIHWKQRGLNRPNRYYLKPLRDWIAESPAGERDTTEMASPDATSVSDPEATDSAQPDPSDASPLDATSASPEEDASKKTQSNVDVGDLDPAKKRTRTPSSRPEGRAVSPDVHSYRPEQLEAKIFQLRQGLRDRGESDFNIRQIVKKLPANAVDEAYYQAVGKYQEDRASNPAGYFIGICKKKAEEEGIDLGFGGEGRAVPRRKVGPTAERHAGPQAIGEILRESRGHDLP